jgi:hypothetical protein
MLETLINELRKLRLEGIIINKIEVDTISYQRLYGDAMLATKSERNSKVDGNAFDFYLYLGHGKVKILRDTDQEKQQIQEEIEKLKDRLSKLN